LIFPHFRQYISTVNLLTPTEISQRLASRIRSARKRKGFTQQELSSRSGVTLASYRRFETTGEVSLMSFIKISQALNLDDEVESLFKKSNYRSLDEIEKSG